MNTEETPQDPRLRLVHQLRAVTVEFDLLAAGFAARHGLHPTDLRALIALLDAARAERPMTPGRLGERLHLNSAGTTTLIDRLERLGLVRRERDTTDRRRVLLTVEPRAVDLGWSFFGPAIGTLLTAMDAFTPEELGTVERFLGAMTTATDTARTNAAASSGT
ncbi:MarR family winged helix-turn-helix transcriptional regulator [Streptomyces collinus]|uniref:Transcriptional regulator, MarR family protein n=1 Tax=Streptomyces collinus (strain DSM 40733 / Tue 365) TaxID=1214242 RepID=S5V1N1_STRC3|nr:MarR family transcriptional regulator [Streptomyces collinus]AGS67206.1 transcriptional regulator, MarR family protein [Streptomyces collinus Tu 365]AGS73488.1 transcriptional regulator, MarR family protein [Streptomyces collinus Tu 365]